VHSGKTTPSPIRCEEQTNLSFAGTSPRIAAAEPPPYILEQTDVPGRQLVVATLPFQSEHLDRPRPNARNHAQPAPAALMLWVVQIDASTGNLACRAHKQARAGTGKVARLKTRRRSTRKNGRRGNVTQTTAITTTWSEQSNDAPLNRSGPRIVDQLLADRPRERLKRLRSAPDPQPRLGTD
jgi:hypothetical protein